jgi:hypothetical protein
MGAGSVSLTHVRTPTWELLLPEDWQEQVPAEGAETYFESRDGTKGVYIATWNIPKSAGSDSRTVAQAFRSAEVASLKRMEGYAWEFLLDEFIVLETMFVTCCDALAKGQEYRIASKVIADVPVVVRAAFHDYECKSFEDSQTYFAPIIHSLRRAA